MNFNDITYSEAELKGLDWFDFLVAFRGVSDLFTFRGVSDLFTVEQIAVEVAASIVPDLMPNHQLNRLLDEIDEVAANELKRDTRIAILRAHFASAFVRSWSGIQAYALKGDTPKPVLSPLTDDELTDELPDDAFYAYRESRMSVVPLPGDPDYFDNGYRMSDKDYQRQELRNEL